jgi:hypothetical protein
VVFTYNFVLFLSFFLSFFLSRRWPYVKYAWIENLCLHSDLLFVFFSTGGRKAFNHVGNERFRKLVESRLEEYSNAAAKLEKSYILSDIVCEVRQRSPQGGFVKRDSSSGRWYEVGDFLAREKTSQAFRDALHDQYKSSNTAKKKRRQAEHGEKGYLDHGYLDHSSHSSLNHSSHSSVPQGSSSSLSFDPTGLHMGKPTMVHSRNYEPLQDSLLGALDAELTAGFGGPKATIDIVGHQSARSVVELNGLRIQPPQMMQLPYHIGQQLQQQSQHVQPPQVVSSAIFNNSCPNLGGWSYEAANQAEVFQKMNNSAPDMFFDGFDLSPSPHRQQRIMHVRRNSDTNMAMDVEKSYRQGNVEDNSDSFGEDLILSPIGDGSPRRLFNSYGLVDQSAAVNSFQCGSHNISYQRDRLQSAPMLE